MRGFNKRSEKQEQEASRTSRWLLGLGALAMAAIGLGLLVLMTQATGNRESYNRNYEWLALINAVVASGLLATILWGAIRLLLRLRRGQFGARLLVKLAGIFALVGVIPGLLIYVVSYQFVSRSIESWFDVKVEDGGKADGAQQPEVVLAKACGWIADGTDHARGQVGDGGGGGGGGGRGRGDDAAQLCRCKRQRAVAEVAKVGQQLRVVLVDGRVD